MRNRPTSTANSWSLMVILVILVGCQSLSANAQSIEQLRKAAEQGVAEAQYNLGFAYDFGEGVPEDDAEAVKWFRQAAEQGHALAQYNLGVAYASGRGVPEDYVTAYAWANLSAARGNSDAAQLKEELRASMTAAQVAEAQKKSTTLFNRIESVKFR